MKKVRQTKWVPAAAWGTAWLPDSWEEGGHRKLQLQGEGCGEQRRSSFSWPVGVCTHVYVCACARVCICMRIQIYVFKPLLIFLYLNILNVPDDFRGGILRYRLTMYFRPASNSLCILGWPHTHNNTSASAFQTRHYMDEPTDLAGRNIEWVIESQWLKIHGHIGRIWKIG